MREPPLPFPWKLGRSRKEGEYRSFATLKFRILLSWSIRSPFILRVVGIGCTDGQSDTATWIVVGILPPSDWSSRRCWNANDGESGVAFDAEPRRIINEMDMPLYT